MKILLFCMTLIISNVVFAQQGKHWELIAGPGNHWQFYNSKSPVDGNWKSVFDSTDQNWKPCNGLISDGLTHQGTLTDSIPEMQSAFLRKTFNLKDTSKIGSAVFYADYRHGIVVWLNGVEICRSLELFGRVPDFIDTAQLAHQLYLPYGGLPERFAIDGKIFKNAVHPGENTLSIQIVNWISSVSATIAPFLFAEVKSDTLTYDSLTSWFVPSEIDSSTLPLIIVNSNNQCFLEKRRIKAFMGIIDNGLGNYNHITDSCNGYNGHISIELRGSSTLGFEKRSYNVETEDSAGNNLDVSVLGMPADNDWIINAFYFDRTMIRNSLMNRISEISGEYAPRIKLCELIVNGHYRGIYAFMERIKRKKGRVNIKKLDVNDNTVPSITGGYIFETRFNTILSFNYPDEDVLTSAQNQYIHNYYTSLEQVVNRFTSDSLFLDSTININSFIHQLFVQEISRNKDAYFYSMYFYKDKDKHLFSGLVWDFDWTLGNYEGFTSNGWNQMPAIWNTLFYERPYFRYWFRQEWKALRAEKLTETKLLAFVDSMALKVDSSVQKRNFRRWPVLGRRIWTEPNNIVERKTYQSEVEYLKSFLVSRLAWMDLTIDKFRNPYLSDVSMAKNDSANILVYPNPATRYLNLSIRDLDNPFVNVEILNITGVVVKSIDAVHINMDGNPSLHIDIADISDGIYFVRVNLGPNYFITTKFIKINN